MNKIQPLSAKIGEVNFRQKLTSQHQGKKTYYKTHTTPKQNLKLLKQRAIKSLHIFKQLKKQKVPLSPFLELGGEKCERAAVITSKLSGQGAVVDLSAESLISAEKFCPKLNLKKLPLRICADAYNLPFQNNSFSFIFAFQTLHHFPDPTPILEEVYRVLAPGGCFYFNEEPVKQLVNLNLWRRDFKLRWWEKILKAMLILPFISKIGKSEVSEGVLEETFDLKTWQKALNVFNKVQAELVPYPFGPVTKVNKPASNAAEAPSNAAEAPSNAAEAPSNAAEAPSNAAEAPSNAAEAKSNWLKPKITTKIMINTCGGGIKATCFKNGNLKPIVKKQNILSLISCPECHKKIIKQNNRFKCKSCNQIYPIKSGVLYILPKSLKKKLYPNV